MPLLPEEGNLVVEAAPGAGKTTRIPAYLLGKTRGQVLVLEPRRLAARLAAKYVASERGERIGQSVGYQVRFEDFTGPQTRLRYLTEGVLNRRLAGDAELRGVDAVILDEFHERHWEGDLALALLLDLQRRKRPGLRIIVMSATLDALPVAEHLGGCKVLRSEGRLFPLAVRYTPESSGSLEDRVAKAIDSVCREGREGDVLVFLPGMAEIRRAMAASEALAKRHHLALFALAGELSSEEQDAALAPNARRKVIFSTNIAESSVTIPGVRVVIDSGLARIAKDSRSSGLPQLVLGKIPQSSAAQRAGRAARQGEGLAIRLYTEQDFLSRPPSIEPEILQRELSGLCLQLRAMGITNAAALPWLSAPDAEDWRRAEAFLDELGAKGEVARRMASLPVAPRLAKMLLEAERRGASREAARAAALLSTRQRWRGADLLDALEEKLERQAERVVRQLEQKLDRAAQPAQDVHQHLAAAILAGFPDRVGKRRREDEFEIAGGAAAKLQAPLTHKADWIVAVDLEERSDQSMAVIRAACPIAPDWLLDLFPERIAAEERYLWNRAAERVEEESALLYRGLVLESSVNSRPNSAGAAKVLAEKVKDSGWRKFLPVEETEQLLARVEFAARNGYAGKLEEADLIEVLQLLCEGRCGFDQVRQAVAEGEFEYNLWRRLDRGTLEEIAPERIKLSGGRSCPVQYVPGQTPWIQSRLQDFWGMNETPRVARGAVPVLVHLLAPNRRPVQVTQDLGSFWTKLYPELRTQLSRRYPKHSWP